MNDDIVMKSIVSGTYLGETPSFQMVFMVFPLNIILYILYNMTSKLDWYGIVLIGLSIFYIMYSIYNVIKQKESITEKIVYSSLLIFLLSFLYYVFLINITFTIISAIIATCCLILYMCPSSKLKNIIMTIGILLAYGIRPLSCLMVIVFFIPLFLFKNIGNKEGLKKDLILGLKIGTLLLSCIIIQNIMVSNKDWKEYLEYNKNRSKFYDYYMESINGNISEEEREIIAYNAGIDNEEMEIIRSYGEIGFIDNLPEKMKNLVNECKKFINKSASNFKDAFIYMLSTFKKLSIFYLVTLLLLGFYLIKKKKKIYIFGLYFIIQIGMLSYLVYQGRLPERVLVPLLSCYSICNIITLFNEQEIKDLIKKVFTYNRTFTIIISIIIFILAISNIKFNAKTRDIVEISNNVLEYFSSHPDNIYIYDKLTLENFQFVNKYKASNYISKMGWTICSPLHKQAINKYNAQTLKDILFKENAYFVLTYPIEKYKERYEYLFGKDVDIKLIDKVDTNYIYKVTKK